MMQAPTYDWYANEFGGTLGEAQFAAAVRPARLRVEYLIGNKDVPEELEDKVREAMCHAAEAYAEYGDGPAGGFTIGSFSVSATADGQDGQSVADGRVRMCLARTGLLFCGVA